MKLYTTEDHSFERSCHFNFVMGDLWHLIMWLEDITGRGFSISEKIETLRFHMSANPTKMMRTLYKEWLEDTRKLTKLPLEDRIDAARTRVARELKAEKLRRTK